MTQINLRALASLKDYSNAELKLLASVAPAREFQPGMPLCREGSAGQSCFLLATGDVHVTKRIDGHDKILATLKSGAIVGQMALVDRSPRSAAVVASSHTIALELTRDVFENLLRASSPLALRFQEQIAIAGIRQLRLADQRLATLLGEKAQAAAETQPEPGPVDPMRRSSLMTVQAALTEWDMTLDDLDQVQVSVPGGQVSATEAKARQQAG